MSAPSPKDHLTTRQAAELLGLTPEAVRALIKSGALQNAFKNRGIWLIPYSDFRTYQQKLSGTTKDTLSLWQRFKSCFLTFSLNQIISTLVIILTLFLAIPSFGADYSPAELQLIKWGLIRPFLPRQEEEILIVIINFSASSVDSDIPYELKNILEGEISRLGFSDFIRVELDPIPLSVMNIDVAKERGQKHKANVIIWGEDRDYRIQFNFVNLSNQNLPLGFSSSPPLMKYDDETPEIVYYERLPKFVALSLFAIANTLIGNQKFDEAIQILKKLSLEEIYTKQLISDLDKVYFQLGYAYFEVGDLLQSESNFRNAINQNFDFPFAYYNLALIYLELNDVEKAHQYFGFSIDLKSDFPSAFLGRCITNWKSNNWVSAVDDCSKAESQLKEINNDFLALLYYYRGRAFLSLGDNFNADIDFKLALKHRQISNQSPKSRSFDTETIEPMTLPTVIHDQKVKIKKEP